MKWTVLTTAPDQLVAEMWRGLLLEDGIDARLDPGDVISYMGVSASPVRVMVREGQVELARKALETYLRGGFDGPPPSEP